MAKPSDSDSLARAINKVLNLPGETAREIRERSMQDTRDRFAWEIIADQHVRYYDEVLTKYGGRPKWGEKEGSGFRLPIAGDVFVSDRAKRK